MTMRFSQTTIPAQGVLSLTWYGDMLVDWVNGGAVYHLDGRCEPAHVSWAFPFDMVRATTDHEFVVICRRLGTKALLLHNGKILRELNRSFYHAHVYEYPICIWKTSEGRTLLAHCPEDYCRIDIEDAESGTCLTKGERKPKDFFHSRLAVNRSGTRLLSAGWVWHPWDGVVYYDVPEALKNPAHLDSVSNCAPASRHVALAEEGSACWQTDERVLLGASAETENSEEVSEAQEPRLRPLGIAVYDVVARSCIRSVVIGEPAGTMMPLGSDHAVCFYEHPKVVSLESGEVMERWKVLKTGNQISSIDMQKGPVPPLAIDVERRRFAVAGADAITVIAIDL